MAYVIGDILHHGTTTLLIASTHPQTNAPVVLKMPQEGTPTAEQLDKLRHEYAMLSEAQGVGIVQPIELWSYGKTLAIVMERWGTSSLDKRLEQGLLPVETALHLGAAIARALGHVHRKGLIHRDVKPKNVLVATDLHNVRLVDFSLAVRRSTYVAEDAAPEHLAGTLAYMAPEQTGRMNRGVDWRADLYSLGATLYEMLTGTRMFEQQALADLVHAQMARTPVALHERTPQQQIPAVVSAIVLKLLAKNPEERYQSADGVAYDLENAAHELKEKGSAQSFALATHDFANRVRKASRLYGREEQIQALLAAYGRVRKGAVEVVFVAGPSGVGKSALVNGLSRHVRETKGIYAAGKFDLIQRGTPYLALSQALRSIVRRRLADSPDDLARWQAAWQKAAGPNGQILVSLMPELVHILGTPPPLVEVGPNEAKNRFMLTVQYFIRETATAEHPLVLFIDDLQWADNASMVLLQQILTDIEATHVLLVGAYRDNEVDADHALHTLKKAVVENQRAVQTIDVAPLGLSALEGMVADMLERPVEEIGPIAAMLKAKTDGSPFFVEQYLRALHEQRLLERDFNSGAWRWNVAQIERARVTDNVALLLTQKLGELSALAQRVLALGACVGATFEAAVVREAEGISDSALQTALEELQQQGLLREASETAHDVWEFVHDRVQQAAYALLKDEQARVDAHHAFAQVFDRRVDTGGNAELFAMLYHALRSLPRLTTEDERLHMAERCVRGGQAAKEGSAYADAVTFLRTGKELLGDAGWQAHFALVFEIHLGLAEAEWLAGQTDVGEALFQLCLERAPDRSTRGRVATVWVQLLPLAGRFTEAIDLGLNILEEFGWSFPKKPDEFQPFLAAQLARIVPTVMAASSEELVAWPKCTDPDALTAGVLLCRVALAIVLGRPEWFPIFCFAMLEHSLRHGVSRTTGAGAGAAAMMAVVLLEDFHLARRFVFFGEMHLPEAVGLYAFSMHALSLAKQYLEPLASRHDAWELAAENGFREGDVSFGEYCEVVPKVVRIVAGHSLMQRAAHRRTYADLTACEFAAASARVSDALWAVDPREGWHKVEIRGEEPLPYPMLLHFNRTFAAFVALHLGNEMQALDYALWAEPHWLATGSIPSLIIMVFALSLTAARLPDRASAAKSQIDHHRARLEKWAAFTPQNFLHMKLLVDAWEARNEGRHRDAEKLFEASIADARENGFLNDEALGLRMAGEYFLELDMPRAARGYLVDAYETYLRWGAIACANAIREKYPQFFAHTHSGGSGETTLDVHTAIRAAQALSSELDPDRVVGRLMDLCTANAGAQRGALVLLHKDSLVLVARLSVADARIETGLAEPLALCRDVPETVVRYVARSREPQVINDMFTENRFADDVYLKSQKLRSLIALPLAHRGNLVGVLYLEHRDAPSVFPPERVELLSVLASQAAIAVENAQQVRVLEVRNREVQQLNDELRRQIAQRSRRLMETLISSDGDTAIRVYEEGNILGDCYRVTKMLGEGGMGAVYEVERTTDGMHLAAKVLNHAPDRNDLGRFAREAEILAKLAHPNLISIFDIDITDEGVLYIVMELVSGMSLGQIQGRTGDVPWVINVVAQVARALGVLHAISIVHRDLKPDNILLMASGPDEPPVVKLADFGISIILDDAHKKHAEALATTATLEESPHEGTTGRHSNLTQTGVLVGTPLYMAPELGYGSRNAQPPSDMFALGVIAFDLLTGKKPFIVPPVMGGVMNENAQTMLTECPGLPAETADILAQCLDMEPEKRPKADEVAVILGRVPFVGLTA